MLVRLLCRDCVGAKGVHVSEVTLIYSDTEFVLLQPPLESLATVEETVVRDKVCAVTVEWRVCCTSHRLPVEFELFASASYPLPFALLHSTLPHSILSPPLLPPSLHPPTSLPGSRVAASSGRTSLPGKHGGSLCTHDQETGLW